MSNAWNAQLDLTDRVQVKEVADLFGGEVYFADNYPELYALFQNSRKAETRENNSNQGYQNSAYIVDVVYDKANRCAFAAAHTYLTEKASRLYCFLEIYRNGESIGKNSGFYHNTDFAKIECSSARIIETAGAVRYEGVFYVAWQPVSQNILRVMKANSLSERIQNDGEEFVESMDISDPVYKKSTSGPIKIALWRTGSDVDYSYPNDKIDDDGNYEMHLKMTGKAKLLENHAIGSVPSVDAILNQVDHGSIFYLHNVTPGEITVSKDWKTLTWDLSDNWENFVPESTRAGNRNYSFDMRISFMCRKCQFRHSLIISSEDYPQYEDYHFYKKIPMINVLWGCLAEGTKITMSDGARKKIEDVRIGDKVVTGDGAISGISDIVVGTESTMYQLVLASGNEVLATLDHPFMTGSGMMLVSDITSHTDIRIAGGAFSRAVSCYPVTYGKKVYSLELSDGDSFIANGVVSGTHSVQGELSAREDDSPETDPLILDEIARLKRDAAEGMIFI